MNISACAEDPGKYRVASESSSDKSYDVDPSIPHCDCPSYQYRESRRGGVCKHIAAVQQLIQETAD